MSPDGVLDPHSSSTTTTTTDGAPSRQPSRLACAGTSPPGQPPPPTPHPHKHPKLPTPTPTLHLSLSASESDIVSTNLNELNDSAQSPRRRARSPTPASPPPPPHLGGIPPPPTATTTTTVPTKCSIAFDPELLRLFNVLRASERTSPLDATYLTARHSPAQLPTTYIDASMRRMCVSWMVEVAQQYEYSEHTMLLAVSSLDRFLSCTRAVPRGQLQLVATASLLVAAKHEEEAHPSVADLVGWADNSFTAADLIQMERLLLTALKFNLAPPTSATFLSTLRGLLNIRPEVHALAAYYLELAMLEYCLLKFHPSVLASAALVLAAGQYNDGATLLALSAAIPGINVEVGYCLSALREVIAVAERTMAAAAAAAAAAVRHAQRRPSVASGGGGHTEYTPVYEKFATEKWHHVSIRHRISLF